MTQTITQEFSSSENYCSYIVRELARANIEKAEVSSTASQSILDENSVKINNFYLAMKRALDVTVFSQRQFNENQKDWSILLPGILAESFGVMHIQTENYSLDIDVISFCKDNDILEYLHQGLEILNKIFSTVINLRICLDKDPESDEAWVAINFTTKGSTKQILAQYDYYTEELIHLIPMSKSGLIRTAFDLE